MKSFFIPLILLLLALPVTAQRALERADSLLSAGEFGPARTLLLEWQRANPPSAKVDPALRARALFLAARLTEDAMQAQELYLTLSLSYPTAAETPDALLRLGQGLLAANENRRALAYLERLISDYPAAANRPQAHLWLARAQIATGNSSAACRTAGSALKSGVSGEVATLLQNEERTACAAPAAEPMAPALVTPEPRPKAGLPSTSTPRAATAPAEARLPDANSAVPSADAARFTVQSGAFRNVQSATNIVSALRNKGLDARVAYLQNSELAYVRIGRFQNRADAVAHAARVKAAGYSAIIAEDVRRER